MTVLDTLTEQQKESLIEIRKSYLQLIKKRGEIKALRDRVIAIDNELKEHEPSIKPNYFG